MGSSIFMTEDMMNSVVLFDAEAVCVASMLYPDLSFIEAMRFLKGALDGDK